MKLEGIVVSSTDYKETSKIVNLYTNTGMVSVIAKGAMNPKKGLLGFITTGNIVSFVTTDSNVKSLMEYSLISSSFDINNSIDTIKAFGVIIDIINEIPEDNNHERTYEFIKNTLVSLGQVDIKTSLCVFLIKMLYVFGIAPNLKTCVRCNKKNVVSFSVISGGALCSDCGYPDIDYLNLWIEYYYSKKEISDYSDNNLDKLLNDVKDYYAYHMGIKIKL